MFPAVVVESVNLCPNLGFYSFRGILWFQASERRRLPIVNLKITVEGVRGEACTLSECGADILEFVLQRTFLSQLTDDRAPAPGVLSWPRPPRARKNIFP